jgi:tetraacyldisaccharide 4'-kinase
LPLVPVYAAAVGLRSLRLRLGLEQMRRLAWPVVSVGNLSSGGTGKTPFVIALAQLLQRKGVQVDVLSRGYGRTEKSPAWVHADGSAEVYGDEPLLITREAPAMVYVGARRWEAGRLAESLGSQTAVHLLDDGFQHRQLARNMDIVLVNSEDLSDWLLPAGNLREGVKALRRATVLAVPVEDDDAVTRLRELGLEQPVWRFRREMNLPEIAGPVVAFCGIARPGQFFSGLEQASVRIAARHVFRDHHRFRPEDLQLLRRLLKDSGAIGFVTTAKDRVRLGNLEVELERVAPLYTAALRIVIEDEAEMAAWLMDRLGMR